MKTVVTWFLVAYEDFTFVSSSDIGMGTVDYGDGLDLRGSDGTVLLGRCSN